MNIQGKTVLVTGAARRVGRAMAIGLASEGARVVIHYGRSRSDAEATVEEAIALGSEAVAMSADLSEPESISSLFDGIDDRFGGLDVLINSAARFDSGPFEGISHEAWQRSLDVNLTAPFLCSQRAARLMRKSAHLRDGAAVIINMADLSGIHPWRQHVQHGVSKAGLLHLTRIMARELAPDVRVNAIVPGAILPPPGVEVSDERWTGVSDRVPLERTGHPADIVQSMFHLIAADFVTGSVLHVDGGESLLGPIGH